MPPPNDRYSSERYNPTLSHCTSLSLHFDGSRLEMRGGSKLYSYPAVSGSPDSHGSFDYSPARQRMRNAGPIPEGVYCGYGQMSFGRMLGTKEPLLHHGGIIE